MEEQKQTSIRDEIQELKELVSDTSRKKKGKKIKSFRLPLKAKVNNAKLKKGYVTVVKMEDNFGVDFIREPIVDGTIKLDDTFHAVEEYDIFNYKGKPLIFQPKSKLNPYNPLKGKHETYGQKYIMARMEGDKITNKKKLGIGISIGALIIGAVIVYALFSGGGV